MSAAGGAQGRDFKTPKFFNIDFALSELRTYIQIAAEAVSLNCINVFIIIYQV